VAGAGAGSPAHASGKAAALVSDCMLGPGLSRNSTDNETRIRSIALLMIRCRCCFRRWA
jgi:hypothetical protein